MKTYVSFMLESEVELLSKSSNENNCCGTHCRAIHIFCIVKLILKSSDVLFLWWQLLISAFFILPHVRHVGGPSVIKTSWSVGGFRCWRFNTAWRFERQLAVCSADYGWKMRRRSLHPTVPPSSLFILFFCHKAAQSFMNVSWVLPTRSIYPSLLPLSLLISLSSLSVQRKNDCKWVPWTTGTPINKTVSPRCRKKKEGRSQRHILTEYFITQHRSHHSWHPTPIDSIRQPPSPAFSTPPSSTAPYHILPHPHIATWVWCCGNRLWKFKLINVIDIGSGGKYNTLWDQWWNNSILVTWEWSPNQHAPLSLVKAYHRSCIRIATMKECFSLLA